MLEVWELEFQFFGGQSINQKLKCIFNLCKDKTSIHSMLTKYIKKKKKKKNKR